MGMCGPVNPCADCRPIYEHDLRYRPTSDGSFEEVPDIGGRNQRLMRPAGPHRHVSAKAVAVGGRRPVIAGSRRSASRARSARRARTS